PSPFNTRLSAQRSVRFFELPLADVMAVKDAAGVKLNDVALSMIGGALRRYLDRHQHPVSPSLITYMPVTQRSGGEGWATTPASCRQSWAQTWMTLWPGLSRWLPRPGLPKSGPDLLRHR
ncbi:MAG TPA: wax ester/triacylglycerol synthase family O-acyltransferase, partial [Marmoricola sp.]|nr:wax ester/triacylglycerol synthase family O-acyltransferase [Marmoricola sp.]